MKTSMFTDEQKAWICKKYMEGYKIADLARTTHANRMSIARLLERYGVKREPLTSGDREQFLSLQ